MQEINVLAIPVVVGLVEVVKRLGLPSQFAPLVSLVFGLGFAFLNPYESIQTAILVGIVYGLSASGLYSGTMSVTGLEANKYPELETMVAPEKPKGEK